MGRERATAMSARAAILVMAIICLAVATPSLTAFAATPASGTIDGSAPVEWDFAPVGGPSGDSDTYNLTVKLPAPAASYYAPDVRTGSTHAAVLEIRQTWTGNDPTQALSLSVTDSKGNSVGNDTLASINDGSDVNVFMLQDPLPGTYTVTAQNFAASATTIASHALAHLRLIDLASQPQPAQPAGARGFDNFHLPLDLMPVKPEEQQFGGRLFGEPSIGVDPKTDAVMYQAGLYTMKGTFDDSAKPAKVSWSDVTFPVTGTVSEDAILYTDKVTGRTFVSQLTLACSLGAYTDDDGANWTPAAKPCQTPAGPDHQTIGAGPFAAPLPQGAVYPDAVYYCSQSITFAGCALSLDGGFTYGAQSQMWTSDVCFGLHGHIKVAPNDGTLYVPNKACGSPECYIVTSTAGPNCHPGFAVSTNNGATWSVQTINEAFSRLYDTGDPGIGIGAQGTMYFGYGDRDGHPKIAVCTNQGTTCTAGKDVGTDFHIENTEMPTVVAGDDNRAAFAFLGSTTPGDDQENSFVGTWHLYVAITTDGGQHWTTTDATPDHPIQRGCIEFNASCPSSRGSDDQRNLLDFNDVTIDREGRVLAAYTDGCQPEVATPPKHGTCLVDATRLSGLPTEIQGPAVARQSCGPGLLAKYDAQMPACPVAGASVVAPAPVTGAGSGLPGTLRAPRPVSPAWVLLPPAVLLAGAWALRRRRA